MPFTFSPPAGVGDFDDAHRMAWHGYLDRTFREAVADVESVAGAGKSQFYHPSDGNGHAVAASEIFWDAFPRALRTLHGPAAFEKADATAVWGDFDVFGRNEGGFVDRSGRPLRLCYRPQDEYCEWFVERDRQTGKILRVTFTCENPEYWETLAQGAPRYADPPPNPAAKGMPQQLLALYRSFYGDRVQPEHLFHPQDVYQRSRRGGVVRAFRAGQYNPYNRWNTEEGAVHLTHRANTLGAEITLGAQATLLRGEPGHLVEDADRLICCAGYGEPNRSSDPTIGSEVNRAARTGAMLSLRDPVGLYIHKLDDSSFTLPDGSGVDRFWRVVRGVEGMALRLVYEVPANRPGLVVGDLLIDGQPVRHGGQIAAHIKMKLVAEAYAANRAGAPQACELACCRQKGNPNYLVHKRINEPCPDGYEDAFAGPVDASVFEAAFEAESPLDASDYRRRR